MVSSRMHEPQRVSGDQATVGRLFLLDLSDDCVVSLNPDGADRKIRITECRYPDGIAVDVEAGHIYWTNMGDPIANDGSIERADFDGRNRKTIVPQGGTFTPKQLQLEKQSGKLYWCDREGMRLMRGNLDGSDIETLVDSSKGDPRPGPDPTKWCVGVAIDVDGGKVYWTQKGPDNAGEGRIFRVGIEIPSGQTASNRVDIELLYDGLPEPIDLELDPNNRVVYWTDRGDPPRGNTVNRAPMDSEATSFRPTSTGRTRRSCLSLKATSPASHIARFPERRRHHAIRQTHSSCCSDRYRSDRRQLGGAVFGARVRRRRDRPGSKRRGEFAQIRRRGLGTARRNRSVPARIPRPLDLHQRLGAGARDGRPRPGKRPRAA